MEDLIFTLQIFDGINDFQYITSIVIIICFMYSVSLRWRLHFEFVTTNENLSPDANEADWNAPLNVHIETMVWNLPVKIYSTLPKQITQHSVGSDAYTLCIK